YEAYKKQKQLADYDDLLIKWLELLENHPDVREKLSADFRYILVDEYQDTNAIQAKIVRHLATDRGNVMAVGDDAQSIYSFRGACFQNMFDFLKDYPESGLKTLEENYRSNQKILDLANGLLDRAAQKHEKRLFSRREGGRFPVLAQTPDESFQSKFICQKILELREENIPLEEIAVLFRSSPHAFDLEIELARYNIPYIKRGGIKLMETAHVKDLLSYLRVAQNPKDAVGWTRILTLLDGVGIRTSQKVIQCVLEAGSLSEGISSLRKEGGKKELNGLLGLLEKLSPLPPAGQVEEALRFYAPALKEKYDDFPKRLKDLEHLQALSEKYNAIDRFLSDVALHPPEESVAGVDGEREEEKLVLSTIHSAKGLEWKAVFIIWALDGKFP
ncbi:MAG TPA: ATP-dependent helicase, partial [Nitrospiria bacterium]|nr:ATP-dependent helicase [Nitrospiria bacterium]